MKSDQLIKSLKKAFSEEKDRFAYRRAIVFWYDADRSFENEVAEIASEIGNVNLIRLDQESALAVKIRLEIEDTQSDYLIYSPCAEPSIEEIHTDWFLSVRLYNRVFRADESSLMMNEFGLFSERWRKFVANHLKFFQSRERRESLKRFGVSDEMPEAELKSKMLAVVVNSVEPELSPVLMNLFREAGAADDLFANQEIVSLSNIEKFGLSDFLWNEIKKKFGYAAEKPNLDDLLRHLFVTDFASKLKDKTPSDLNHFRLPRQTSNFLAAWRDRNNFAENYRRIANRFEKELNLSKLIAGLSAADLAETHTFAEADRHILREVRDKLLANQTEVNFESNLKLLAARSSSFWTKSGEENFTARIEALSAALRFFELKKKYAIGFPYPTIEDFFEAYTNEIYLFDQYYRHFYESANKIDASDFLKKLGENLEDCYLNWYLPEMSESWSKFIANESGAIWRWRIKNVPSQQAFFKTNIAPILEQYAQTTVYIIISDAFRYEAAAELNDELNQRFGDRKIIKSKISVQLGVLPSYTTLGMASLLPGDALRYSENGADVLVDGVSTQGIANRRKILGKHEGTAIHLKELSKMKTEEGRDFVRQFRVVYIYHDEIDSTGEKAVSEHKTFAAVRGAIDDIHKTVDFIVKSLDGTHIFITADHGFLFQDTKLDQVGKSSLDTEPKGTLKSNKRYIVGNKLGKSNKVWHGLINHTAEIQDEMEFWIPRGINRFRFSGGARFVHGGAMPQEIAVPVIYARTLHGKKNAERSKNRLVNVTLINQNIRIVTNIHRFEFLQTEPVSIDENRLPRVLLVSLRDGDEIISNEVRIAFDSESGKLDDRRQNVQIYLNQGEYDRKKEFILVLRDEVTNVQYNSFPVTIDLAFGTDF